MCLSCFKGAESSHVDDGHDLQPPRIALSWAQEKAPPKISNASPKPAPPLNQPRQESIPPLEDGSHQAVAKASLTVNGVSSTGHDTVVASDGIATIEPSSGSVGLDASSLWQQAYKKLAEDDPDLIRDLETIIKEDAELDSSTDIKLEIQNVVAQQKTKMESKQWSFNLLGVKEVKVRETVDSILSLIDRGQGLISAGMTFAPPYISIPWTAVSSLIPLMLKDAKRHQEAIDGLERVAKILWCYTIAEEGMLPDPNTQPTYSTAALDLYTTLLQYQALAARYFGAKTIKRIWGIVTATTSWSDISAKIIVLDDDCRRCIAFMGFREQQRGNAQLMTALEEHSKTLKLVLANTDNANYEKKGCLDWISMIKYGADHDNVRDSLGESYLNRGRWLFESEDFKDWQNSKSGVFLLKGTPGTGKSSLTSIVIQDFIDTPTAYLAYFYCSRKEKTTRRSDTTTIIRSLVRCLSVNGHPAFKSFLEDYRDSESRRADGCELQLKKCIALLKESFAANSSKAIVIIVDALDECVDPDGLLAALKLIWASGQQNLRLFLSSRYGVDVKATFPDVVEADIGESNTADIRYYLQTEIEKRRSLQQDTVMTPEQATDLEQVLIEYAGGMFQWVTLEVEIFLSPDIMFQDTIDEKIQSLKRKDLEPIDQLNEAYDQVYLNAIGKDDPNRKVVVQTALQWMLHAYEEFHIEDLALIASIKSDGTALRPFPTNRLLRMCSNFIVKNSSGVLRLSHLTVRPYLEIRQDLDNPFLSPTANLRAAMICLRFLMPGQADSSLERICQTNQAATQKVRSYSNKYWTLHSRDAKVNDQTPLELNCLISSLYKNALPSSTMHVAVRYGQVDAVQYGIATGANIEAKNLVGNTLVHEAVHWRSLPVLELLLASGIAIDSQNNVGDTALHLASRVGLVEFAEALLRHEADTNLPNYHGFAPLHISVHYGHPKIVQLLLRFGANIDQTDPRGNTALHFSSMTSQDEIVTILLGAGCNRQLVNKDGETPLALAKGNAGSEIETLLNVDRKNTSPSLDSNGTSGPGTMIPSSRVDFDTSGFCLRCDVQRWYKSALQGLSDAFYPSYKGLLESSEKGCPMCKVFVREIEALGLERDYLHSLTSGMTIQMILCSSKTLGTLDQDILVISIGSDVRLELEICIDRAIEDTLGKIFSGRTLDADACSREGWALTSNWIKTCRLQHAERQTEFEPTGFPTRLINIRKFPHVFLEHFPDSSSFSGEYVYLSFNWGKVQPQRTMISTLEDHLEDLGFDQLPQTFKDGIELASFLAISYIWIDALCVIQDSAEDWQREAGRMGNYIRNAACVVSALASEHVDAGIFSPRPPSSVSLLALPVSSEGNKPGGCLHLRKKLLRPRDVLSDFMAKRGWRMQETALAKRIIFSHKEQQFWNCGTCLLSEGSVVAQKPILQINVRPFNTANAIAKATNNPLQSWYSVIEVSTASLLTFPSDKLPAVWEVAITLQKSLHGHGLFSQGLWVDDLWRGLLWRSQHHMKELEKRGSSVGEPPTWSWASLEGAVSYSLATSVHSYPVESAHEARLLESHDVNTTTDYMQFGSGGLLDQPRLMKLSAMSISLKDLDASLNCECLFDLADNEIRWLDDRSNTNFVVIQICKWYSDTSEAGSRWMGLILDELEEPEEVDESEEVNESGEVDEEEELDEEEEVEEEEELDEAEEPNNNVQFKRVGLFLGPQDGVSLAGWERREFRII